LFFVFFLEVDHSLQMSIVSGTKRLSRKSPVRDIFVIKWV